MERTDSSGVPIIEGVSAKVGVLERRADFLKRKLAQDSYGSTTSAEFDRQEASALKAAVRALRFHAATFRPDIDPVVHLDRLARASRKALSAWQSELLEDETLNEDELQLQRVLQDAEAALSEL